MEEYPLAVGVGFAALGALIGVLLPRTRQEDELLGEQSDELVRQRKRKAKNCWNEERQSRNGSVKALCKRPSSRASRQKRSVIKYPNLPEKSERSFRKPRKK